jgi:hypothetical protein
MGQLVERPPRVWEKVGGRKWSTSDGISFDFSQKSEEILWREKKKKMGDVTYTYARSTQLYGQTLSLRVLVSPPEEFT